MNSVIIPAAGWGTRALPASKSIPKEMFPVYDRPIIQYIVEEALSAQCNRIVFVTSKGKNALEDHFDISTDLEVALEKSKKQDLLEMVQKLSRQVMVHSVRQKEQLGLGHAIWMGRSFIQDSHFGAMLGDDMIEASVPGMKQLVSAHQSLPSPVKEKAGVILLMEVPESEVSKYGICELSGDRITKCIEKPKPSATTSRWAIIGRYLLPRTIFQILENQKRGENGEIQLTDALQTLAERGELYACKLKGQRFDAGDRLGFLRANLHYYLQSPLREGVIQLLKESIHEFK